MLTPSPGGRNCKLASLEARVLVARPLRRASVAVPVSSSERRSLRRVAHSCYMHVLRQHDRHSAIYLIKKAARARPLN